MGKKTLIRKENPASKTAVPPLARASPPCSGAPLGKPPRRATPTQVQPAQPGFSPLHVGFAPCSGAPLGKPPPGNANAGSARVARVSALGMQGAKPLA